MTNEKCLLVIVQMDDVRKEYWLAVELATERTLQEYLKANAVDWERFYSLVLSVVGGLCFLHTEIRKDGTQFGFFGTSLIIMFPIRPKYNLFSTEPNKNILELPFVFARRTIICSPEKQTRSK
jgi:hypothetical protein